MSNDHYNKLTAKQEKFVQELVRGKTQRQAMLSAYPSRKKWKAASLDQQASREFRKPHVRARYNQVIEEIRETEQKSSLWTREQAIDTLKYVINVNQADLERMQAAADKELEILQKQINEDPDNAAEIIQTMINKRKRLRASHTNNKGIVDAVSELNRMQGFREETINMNEIVMFVGEDELEE